MNLQAKSRLLAWDVNFVGRETNLFPDFKLNLDKVQLIRKHGVFVVYGNTRGVYIVDNNKVVGILTLRHNRVDKSWIDPKMKGKGLGILLYESALKHFKRLASSDSLSPGSSQIWKILCTKYGGYLVVNKGGKRILVEIAGWRAYEKFVFPLVRKEDSSKLVSLRDILRNQSEPESRKAASNSYYEITI